MSKLFCAFVAVGATCVLMPAAAPATDIVVNTTADEQNGAAPCSLREAIDSANSDAAANGCAAGNSDDTILFSPAAFPLGGAQEVIDLTALGTLNIFDPTPDDLNIIGPGFDELAIDAPPGAHIFDVALSQAVSMTELVLRGTDIDVGGTVQGGAIYNAGDLFLDEMIIEDNEITASSLGADSIADGAGIFVHSAGTLTLDFSIVRGNTATASNIMNDVFGAQAHGAGIYSEGILHIHDSAIHDNHAIASDTQASSFAGANGGGVRSVGGAFDADHSSFVGNTVESTVALGTSQAVGAGIMSDNAAQLELNTVALNTTNATGGASPEEDGAGVYIEPGAGQAFVISSTVAQNGPEPTAAVDGSNLFANGGTTIVNTILASPLGGGENCAGPVTSNGYNVDFSPAGPSCLPAATTDLTTNPLLDPAGPGFNGGFSADYPLLPGSPAIDSGTAMFQLADPGHDQRGQPRPVDFPAIPDVDDGSDRGSVEQPFTPSPGGGGSPPVIVPGPAGPTGQRAAALKKCAKIKNKKKKKKCKKRARRLPV